VAAVAGCGKSRASGAFRPLPPKPVHLAWVLVAQQDDPPPPRQAPGTPRSRQLSTVAETLGDSSFKLTLVVDEYR
jgi:hypothetical protein